MTINEGKIKILWPFECTFRNILHDGKGAMFVGITKGSHFGWRESLPNVKYLVAGGLIEETPSYDATYIAVEKWKNQNPAFLYVGYKGCSLCALEIEETKVTLRHLGSWPIFDWAVRILTRVIKELSPKAEVVLDNVSVST